MPEYGEWQPPYGQPYSGIRRSPNDMPVNQISSGSTNQTTQTSGSSQGSSSGNAGSNQTNTSSIATPTQIVSVTLKDLYSPNSIKPGKLDQFTTITDKGQIPSYVVTPQGVYWNYPKTWLNDRKAVIIDNRIVIPSDTGYNEISYLNPQTSGGVLILNKDAAVGQGFTQTSMPEPAPNVFNQTPYTGSWYEAASIPPLEIRPQLPGDINRIPSRNEKIARSYIETSAKITASDFIGLAPAFEATETFVQHPAAAAVRLGKGVAFGAGLAAVSFIAPPIGIPLDIYFGGKAVQGALRTGDLPLFIAENAPEIVGAGLGGGIVAGFKPEPRVFAESSKAYTGIGIKLGEDIKPIIGKTPSGIKIGTPKDIKLEGFDYLKDTVPQGKIESGLFISSVKKSDLPSSEISKVTLGTDLMKANEKIPSNFVRDSFLKETKTLKETGVNIVLQSAKKSDAFLYGSFPQAQQIMPGLRRTAADLDINLPYNNPVKAESFARNLLKDLTNSGEKVRISKENPTLIESFVGGQWHHAVDIHYKGQFNEQMPIDRAYGFSLNQPPIKIEGIKTQRLSEQGLRKGSSIFIYRKNSFAPEPHRIKDIGDFINIQKTLTESRTTGKQQLFNKISEFEKLYPNLKNNEGAIKIELYRPPSKISSKGFPSIGYSYPGSSPSLSPSRSPSISPSLSPSRSPSRSPSISPSLSPSRFPSRSPSISPSLSPSRSPSLSPSISPSVSLSRSPSPYSNMPRINTPKFTNNYGGSSGSNIKRKGSNPFGRGFKYAPSLGAIAFNIRSKKVPKTLTGLELRPIKI